MRRNHWQRLWLAYLILALCLTLTITAYAYVKRGVNSIARQRFETASRTLRESIQYQLERYIDTLISTRGFLDASDNVSREEWRTYTQSIDLRDNYPGILGIGFAVRVEAAELQAHEASVHAEGFTEYQVTPPGPRDVYFPILLLEPFDERNRRAFGFDMYSEPTRQAAMKRAVELNGPAATGAVRLVQETDAERQWGFLVYMPTYRPNLPLATPEQRRAALRGFVYSPYRMNDVVLGALRDRPLTSPLHFAITDGTTPEKGTRIFDSSSVYKEQGAPTRDRAMSITRPINVADRQWVIQTWPGPDLLASSEANLPWLVLTVGMLMSWLIFGISWMQIRGRMQADLAAEKVAISERAARDSELRYRRKIEQSPQAVLTLSPIGEPLLVNKAFEDLWGLKYEDLRGTNVLNSPLFEELGLQKEIERVRAGQQVVIGPIFIPKGRTPSGAVYRERWVRSVVYPILDDRGTLKELVSISEDFTERKEAEQVLQQAKESAEAANRAKDQFLAVLSHELRNPLAPVLAMVSLLQDHHLNNEQAADAMATIRRNVELEARLIDDLLDITRITRGKLALDLQPADAHELLQHAMEICTPDIMAKKLQLITNITAKLHHLRADPARLQQIFWNIIKNAVKFTPEGGMITIATRNDTFGALVISVTDSGIGVPRDKLSRIFDAFEQADRSITQRFGGLGLGLAISKALTEAHRGTIAAYSEGPGKGTTFTLAFPTIAPQATRPTNGKQYINGKDVEQEQPLRILLVEDQHDARRAMVMLLEKMGYTVRAAENASAALDIARGWTFDVMVSDVGLPDESGFELVKKIHAIRDVPAIALTGLGMEADIRTALAVGFDEHLTKPVQLERLEAVIQKLARRQAN